MAQHRVLKRIQHNGVWYEPGDPFEIDDRDSSALIAAEAIERVEDTPPETTKAAA